MSYYLKILSSFNNKNIYINNNTNNNNTKFQFDIKINLENKLDIFDYGQFFVSRTDPRTDENGITIFNPFSAGFLNSTGKKITQDNYFGTTAGAITFLPETILDKISFTQSRKSQNSKNIRLVKNNIPTNHYLTYYIDRNQFYFLEIIDTMSIPPQLNCDWYIEILKENAPNI